jgi:hypothetical protein
MLVDWTNHLGEQITNHLSEVIQFEKSEAVDKYLTASVEFNPRIFSGDTRERYLASSLEIVTVNEAELARELYLTAVVDFVNDHAGNITREILLNRLDDTALIWTNHHGQAITNHLGENIYLIPPHSFDVSMDLTGNAAKHKIIGNASIEISNEISSAEIAKHKLLEASIDVAFNIAASDLRERYLNSKIEIINEVEAELVRERNLLAAIDINTSVEAAIRKVIGWWETIIVKFKE